MMFAGGLVMKKTDNTIETNTNSRNNLYTP